MDDQLSQSVEEIKQGNTKAFTYVVEKYQVLAYNIALSIVKNEEEAEEVVQDAFVKIYRFIRQYNGESRFSSWLYKIVYNTALTRVNSNAKAFLRQDELKQEGKKRIAHEQNDVSHLDLDIRKEWITSAIDRLSESDQLLITLFYFAEKSIPEIAEITSWKKSKCKVKLMRAREKLAELLKYKKHDLL